VDEFESLQDFLENILLRWLCISWGWFIIGQFLIPFQTSRYEIVDTLLAVQHEYVFILDEVPQEFHRIVPN
jgi:hypothetical protein